MSRGHQGEGVAASVKRLKPHTTTTSFFLSAIHQLSLEFLDLSVSLSAGGESAQDMTRAPFFGSKPSSMQRLSLAFPPASFAPSSLMASQFTTHTASACTTKIALFSFSSWSGASSKDLSNPCPLSVQGSRHFCIAAALGAGSSACRGRGRCRFSLLQLLCSLLPDCPEAMAGGSLSLFSL